MLQDELHAMVAANAGAKVKDITKFPFEIVYADKETALLQNDMTFNNDNHYFFCGAVADVRGHIVGIPNKYPHVLDIDPVSEDIGQWGDIILTNKKGWTGGVLAIDHRIYGFPRGADSFLRISTDEHTIEYVVLPKKYFAEHHYGGAMSKDGIVYQPPKGSHEFLKYDIFGKKIEIIPVKSRRSRLLFYGASADMNNNIYFFPAGRMVQVAMADKDGRISFIGRMLWKASFNSGTLAPDGDIYGFSSYGNGILHISTEKRKVNVLEPRFHGGFFGAKLAFNGKIYGIPGDSDEVAEFDPVSKKVMNVISLPTGEHGRKAKCAGGAIDREGNIWCVPAMGNYIYKISFSGIKVLPSENLYRSNFFASTY